MQISQKEKRKVPTVNKDELKVRKLLLKYKEKFFPKQEMPIKDDVENQIKKLITQRLKERRMILFKVSDNKIIINNIYI